MLPTTHCTHKSHGNSAGGCCIVLSHAVSFLCLSQPVRRAMETFNHLFWGNSKRDGELKDFRLLTFSLHKGNGPVFCFCSRMFWIWSHRPPQGVALVWVLWMRSSDTKDGVRWRSRAHACFMMENHAGVWPRASVSGGV